METTPEKRLAEIILKAEIVFAKGGIKCPPNLPLRLFDLAVAQVDKSEEMHLPVALLLKEFRLEILEWALMQLDLWNDKIYAGINPDEHLKIRKKDIPKDGEEYEIDEFGKRKHIKAIDNYLSQNEKEFF